MLQPSNKAQFFGDSLYIFYIIYILIKHIYRFREELAVIENRILEKELVAKKKAEKRAKNIAVSYTLRNE